MFESTIFHMSDGVRIRADVWNPSAQKTIILAHGGGQTRYSWSGAARMLSENNYRVINYDARGHGDSDWSPDNTYPMTRRWGDLQEVAASVEGPLAVVGASMGGGSALFGLSQGFRPSALILVDIAPNSDRQGMQRVRDFMASGLAGFSTLEDVADAVSAYNPSRPRPKNPEGLKKNLRLGPDDRWYWHWDPGMIELDIDEEREIMGKTMDALGGASSVPTLLVRGLQSDVVTDETVKEFRRYAPGIHVMNVGGAGHMVAGDKNDAFNTAILEFLSAEF